MDIDELLGSDIQDVKGNDLFELCQQHIGESRKSCSCLEGLEGIIEALGFFPDLPFKLKVGCFVTDLKTNEVSIKDLMHIKGIKKSKEDCIFDCILPDDTVIGGVIGKDEEYIPTVNIVGYESLWHINNGMYERYKKNKGFFDYFLSNFNYKEGYTSDICRNVAGSQFIVVNYENTNSLVYIPIWNGKVLPYADYYE